MSPRTSDLFLRAQSDERLVNLSRAGHDRAFAAIVNRYRRELLAFARRQTSDGRAEDIVQQSLLNAFAALQTGKEVKHLRGWLYQIVRNTAHGAAEQPTVALHESVGAGEPLERLVERRMVAREVLAAVSNLPDRQREALVGSAWHELPGAALAETMGLSEGALRQLVHRARGAVRTAVSAITPYPLIRSLAGGGGAPELAAGVGGAAAGGLALKVGAVAVTAVLAGTALGGHQPRHRASAHVPNRSHHAVMPGAGSGAIQLSSVTPLATLDAQRDQSRSLTEERQGGGERDMSSRDGHRPSSGGTRGEDGGRSNGDSTLVSGTSSSGGSGGPGNSGGTPGGSGQDGGSSSDGSSSGGSSSGGGTSGDGGSGSDGGHPAQTAALSTTEPDSGQAASVPGPSSSPTGGGGSGPGPGDSSVSGSGSSSGGESAGGPSSTDGLAGSSQTSTSR
jgi:RNA polymerase sigma factor (sigma-70 family)